MWNFGGSTLELYPVWGVLLKKFLLSIPTLEYQIKHFSLILPSSIAPECLGSRSRVSVTAPQTPLALQRKLDGKSLNLGVQKPRCRQKKKKKKAPELTKRKETEKNSPANLIRPFWIFLNHFVVDCFCLDLLFWLSFWYFLTNFRMWSHKPCWSNKQTQRHKQTNKQTNKQTSEQANKQTSKQASKQTTKQTTNQPTNQTNNQDQAN